MKKNLRFAVKAKKGRRAEIRCSCGKLVLCAKKQITISGS